MGQQKYLIIGASGTVGSEIVRLLNQQGYFVLQASSQKNMERAQGKVHLNLVTGEGLRDAFEGIDRAFFISPPGYADQYALLAPLIQEAKRRGLSKVVLMTAMGANAVEASPFRRAEIELEKSGLNYNIIRPNWFFQNMNTFWIQDILQKQHILLPAGNAKVSFIDARDIAAVATQLLTNDDLKNRDFDITGPKAVDHNEVAQAITKASGKTITYKNISPDEFKENLLSMGLPKDYVEFLAMIMGFLREGYSAGVTNSVKEVLQREPLALSAYVNDYQQKWK